MDADAYLRRQGWKGSGHSLDTRGAGLKKPLLIAHKQDQLGLGKKKAAHNVDDQWWMRAFDESLQNIGSGQESTLSQIRKNGINRGGLYGFFVKGEGMPGTISNTVVISTATTDSSALSSRAATPPVSSNEASDASDSAVDVSADRITKVTKIAGLKRKREDGRDTPGKGQDVGNGVRNRSSASSEAREAKVMMRIDRKAERIVTDKEKAGEFGPKPAKPVKTQGKKTSKADVDNGVTKQAYKRAKKQREQDMLAALEEAKKQLIAKAIKEGKSLDPKEKFALQNGKRESVVERTTSELDKGASHHRDAAAAKIAKLTELEKAQYEKRAAAKNQTLEQYALRRLEKKKEKKSGTS